VHAFVQPLDQARAEDNFRPRRGNIQFRGQNWRGYRSSIGYSKELIENNGLKIRIIEFGVMGEPAFAPDITRQDLAKEGGGDLATLASGENKDGAMRVMATGLTVMWDQNAACG
jgi:hypothetical protein